MRNSKEIAALISLLDDPDQIVFEKISAKVLSLGPAIIPNLESQWEQSLDSFLQERIENEMRIEKRIIVLFIKN